MNEHPENYCFECGGLTDYVTNGIYCCHLCRAYLRESYEGDE